MGCFSEIPPPSLPTHPLLSFVFNSLQVKLLNYLFLYYTSIILVHSILYLYVWTKVSSSFDVAVEVLIELVSRYEVCF